MSRQFRASSLSAALVLALLPACSDDGGDDSGSAGSSSGAPIDTSTGGPSTAGETAGETDGGATGSGSDGTSTDASATSDPTGTDGTSTGGSSGGSTGAHVDPCEESVLTWENFGEGFMLSWCTGCHHSALPNAQRADAPCRVNLDTHAGASAWAPLIKLRAIDYMTIDGLKPMPPSALIPEAELDLLREWIECGAKGPETGQATLCCPDPGPNDVCG